MSDIAVVIVFLVTICLPAADALFDFDPTRLSEKRRLAPPPVSRVAYSRALLSLGVSSMPSVIIIGKLGWLFFAGDEALASYWAVQPLAEAELTRWQRRLERRQAG